MAAIAITATAFVTSANARLVQGVAGASMTRGQSLYYDSAAGTYKLFDADDTTKDTFFGFACEDAASGQQVLIVTQDPDLILGGTIAVGDTVWGSATAGGVTKTAADNSTGVRVYSLGVCTAAGNHLNFYPVRGGIVP